MINPGLLVILREIELECYRQIALEQRGGRAVEEDPIDDMPEWDDFAEQIDKKLPPPSERTLADIVNAASATMCDGSSVQNAQKDANQIGMDEAIANASKPEHKQAEAQAGQKETAKEKKENARLTLARRVQTFLQARYDWRMEKSRKEYEYECAKVSVKERVYGFEYMARFIEKYIADLNKIEAKNEKVEAENADPGDIHPVQV